MPTDIGADEAKTRLPALLERVARGERFTITKHGRPVARLVLVARSGPDRRREAIRRLKAFREGQTLDVPVKKPHQPWPAVTALVLDASVVLSWCFKTKRLPPLAQFPGARHLLQHVVSEAG